MASKKKKSKFIHAGCFVYIIGWLIAGLLVAFFKIPMTGEEGTMTYGQLLGLIFFVGSISVGLPMSKHWSCGRCGTKLAGKKVQICPACNSVFEK